MKNCNPLMEKYTPGQATGNGVVLTACRISSPPGIYILLTLLAILGANPEINGTGKFLPMAWVG
jgi:hypothetical protein